MIPQFTIGLSGHIDHGKTSIVKALTGKNTDNLQEEILRGMTINIGFAFLNENITLIDVPGHEKFIKNMVSGVSSIDYAILVVAADDGIMPQTIEHFDILKLLNIKRGLVVINKIDLVDKEWLELIELELYELMKNSFLEDSPIMKISAINNIGINELKKYLVEQSKVEKHHADNSYFRMFVDRVFKAKGFGQIVTGTIKSGSVRLGNKLQLLPDNQIVKVRGLQTHDAKVQSLYSGSRAAINLQSSEKLNIVRGSHLSDLNSTNFYSQAIIEISILSKYEKGLKNNERVRFYLGTQEIMARIFFVNEQVIASGKSLIALIKFEKKIVVSLFDTFIIRTFSPLVTIGGGRVLDLGFSSSWRNVSYRIKCLIDSEKNENSILESIIEYQKENPISFKKLEILLSRPKVEIEKIFTENNKIIIIDDQWILTKNQYSYIKKIVINFFEKFHEVNNSRLGLLKKEIIDRLMIEEDFIYFILEDLKNSNILKYVDDLWSLKDFQLNLSDKDRKISEELVSILKKQRFQTYTILECQKYFNCSKNSLKSIIEYCISSNEIIMINGELLFEMGNFNALLIDIKVFFNNNNSLDIKNFKEIADTSRKYAVPLLEYLDKIGLTYRDGNNRKLKK